VARHEVPHRIVVVGRIPLTVAGKADRKALAAMLKEREEGEGARAGGGAASGAGTAGSLEAVRSAAVAQQGASVSDIFCKVLGHGIAQDASFFHDGGTSLTAMQVCSEVSKQFGVELTLGMFMKAPTLGEVESFVQNASMVVEAAGIRDVVAHGNASGPVAEAFPMYAATTVSQSGIYVEWKMESDPRNAYNVPLCFTSDWPLEYDVVAECVRCLVEWHEVYRTHFAEADGRVLQVVEATADVPVTLLRVAEREEALVWLRRLALVPFDLRKGPLLRVVLVEWAGSPLLGFFTHHIIYDHGCEHAVFGNFMDAYTALSTTGMITAEPRRTSMRGFATWEARMLAERGKELRAFWEKALARAQVEGLAGTKMLGAGAREDAVQLRVTWGEDFAKRLRGSVAERKWTLPAVLHAAYTLFMCEQTGSKGALISLVLSQRDHPQFAEAVGYMMNMVFVWNEMEPGDSAAALVERCQQGFVNAVVHGMYPGPLINAVYPGLYGSGVGTSLDLVPMFPFAAGSMLQPISFGLPEVPLNMVQFVGKAADDWGLVCINYRKGNFEEPAMVERLLQGFYGALVRIVDGDVGCASGRVPQASSAGLQVSEWNHNPLRLLEGTFQELVARCVAGNARVRETLVDVRGVCGIGDVAAVHMKRSDLLVAMLYSLTCAGAAFLPLDAQYGDAVLRFRLADSGASVCVVDAWKPVPCASRLALATELRVWEESLCDVAATGTDLGYLYYTSGSTGLPKGARVLQWGVPNFLQWMFSLAFALSSKDIVLVHMSISFDPTVHYVFWPLVSGCRIGVGQDERVRSAEGIVSAMVKRSVTAVCFVPSHLGTLLGPNGIVRCSSLKLLMSGGEALSREALWSMVAELGLRDFCQWYGPTEATCASYACEALRERRGAGSAVPLGRPCVNTSGTVSTDAERKGQLLLGGANVGGGYLNLEAKTRERFVYDVDLNDGGSRVYDSG
ncbi:MAG: condensation domain-containing protein, partial [Roseimicrobium sp.]